MKARVGGPPLYNCQHLLYPGFHALHGRRYGQILRRARLKFAELLVEEIGLGLDDPSPTRIEEELAALELLEYVRDFLPADWKQRGELAKDE